MKMAKSEGIKEVKVELVPLIDCVFLLLIFFMCAATMAKVDSAADVDLPIASNAAEQKDPAHRGTVNILIPGTYTLKGELVTDENPFLVMGDLVSDEGLADIVKKNCKEDPLMRLYIRANRDVKFKMVRRAMTAAAAGGIADVIFATHLQDLMLKEN